MSWNETVQCPYDMLWNGTRMLAIGRAARPLRSAPVPVTTQAATTQVVTTQTPHPAVPVSTLALHTTVAATTPHPVTTQAPVP
eukprot:6480672-Amphidinium_carterae.1